MRLVRAYLSKLTKRRKDLAKFGGIFVGILLFWWIFWSPDVGSNWKEGGGNAGTAAM
jgi:hypothetical protein